MSVKVCWDEGVEQPQVRQTAVASLRAVDAGDKDAWLALFAEDAVLADPVGPSGFDPEGKGHRGLSAIAAFWDKAISQVERFEFVVHDSHACGDELANVATFTSYLAGGYRVDTELVSVYRIDERGKLASLKAYWEPERAMATARLVKS